MFSDRVDAGDRLARLVKEKVAPDSVVLGLPRGGVPVAARVSAALDLDLDVIVVRKVGLATNSELAMGAVGEGGVVGPIRFEFGRARTQVRVQDRGHRVRDATDRPDRAPRR